MNESCPFCPARERMDREWRAAYGDEAETSARIITTCECGGVNRFIVYGLSPTTEEEAQELFCALMAAFKLDWPKTRWSMSEICDALNRHEKLELFAQELGVGKRRAQDLVKWATGGTFTECQRQKADRKQSRMDSRLDSSLPIRPLPIGKTRGRKKRN